ncbi:hypothetical protein BUALT_Bualt08G0034100 [Buddleja alternifolia]|uniref:Growth-regulating factor n=1 Tax=Buddleja alternifolia TaxID=168488 RepID=A0AAV6X7E2_9LAMI|nr:hypothetical protein BUALT_Bualt08G0034100 [Buddleja alternifolia]
MDFGHVVGFHNFDFSNSKNGNGNGNGDDEFSNPKWYGSGGNRKQERRLINNIEGDDEYLRREFKVANKTCSSSSSAMMKIPSQHRYYNDQMLSFSSSPTPSASAQTVTTLPCLYNHNSSTTPGGYGYEGLNSRRSMLGLRGPFTASQWMELEHQALIYKYITANVPIPSCLLNPITKAFNSSSAFSAFSALRPNALGWGSFHLGFSNTDPEPGRCRRTDGKKWRCSRDAVVDQKYCERHLNRGRNRSRKPVEPQQPPHSTKAKLPPMASSTSACVVPVGGGVSNNLDLSHSHKLTNLQPASGIPNMNRSLLDKEIPKDNQYSVSKQQNAYQESSHQEFGLVCSDSLLNPLNRSSSLVNFRNYGTTSDDLNDHETKSQHALRQFMDNWPKNQPARQNSTNSWPDIDLQPDRTQLSISIPTYDKHGASPVRLSREIEATQMGLGVGSISSWESSMGGPLGEVLHTTSEWKNGKALNFMEKWPNNSPSSPTRVLQRGAFGSLSNSSTGSSPRAESSRTLEGVSLCSGALVHPSLPAL